MFNITKFNQIVSPVLLLASILLFNNLTLAADGAPGVAVAAILMIAARHGHTAVITQLLAAGADVNARANDGRTALIWAAIMGHTEVVTQLLAAGADVNTRDNDDRTALMGAAEHGRTAIVTQLLAAGADVNIRNNDGSTALMYAAINDLTATVTQLLAAGAEIPAELQEHAQILAQSEQLRNTQALIRTLNSGYHKQVIKVITHSEIATILAASDLSTIDFAQHKFIINPGVEILPDFDLLATGTTRAVGEYGPEITPEEFSVLDLAILSCQPALVDQLLMSGMSPAHLTQQTRDLLERFPAPGGGAREAKGAGDHAMTVGEVATVAESEQITHMIYYATMAHTIEVQDRIKGLPGSCDTTKPLPEPVERYAKAIVKQTAASVANKRPHDDTDRADDSKRFRRAGGGNI